jgi:hypothetical protein
MQNFQVFYFYSVPLLLMLQYPYLYFVMFCSVVLKNNLKDVLQE